MKLQIENIGAIGSAQIAIDGITVIAGENSSGKSTVGKTLYAILHNMASWPEYYQKKCRAMLGRLLEERSVVLEDLCMKISGAKRRRTSKVKEMLECFLNDLDFQIAVEDYQYSRSAQPESAEMDEALQRLAGLLQQYCREYVGLYLKNQTTVSAAMNDPVVTKWIDRMLLELANLEMDELALQSVHLLDAFSDIFKNQYCRIGSDKSSVQLTDDDDRKVTIELENGFSALDAPIRTQGNVYFLESPKVYDLLSDLRFAGVQKEYLRELLTPNVFKERVFRQINPQHSGTEKLLAEGDYASSNILDDLKLAMGGRSEYYQKVGLEFKDDRMKETIHSDNVSSGLKSLALLEYALRLKSIMPGDILILDEPEINLHPKWQTVYAKALVDLQKQFGIKLIIASHSPYFIRAIEVYADLADAMDKLNVYSMTRNAGNIVEAENVSYSEYGVTELYNRLSAPLEKLEDLLFSQYGEDGQ